MRNQTIGVEIECNGITRARAAKISAHYFGTDRSSDTSAINGYCAYSAWDQKGREWKFVKDVSIEGRDDCKCEVVTPILNYDDLDLLQGLVRTLRKAGAKSDATRGCGVHIHIGASGMTANNLRTLTNLMASHENLLTDALAISSSRTGSYCKPTDKNFLKVINAKKPQNLDDFKKIWYESQGSSLLSADRHYNGTRYHMLNLHATFTKGTVEFRLFQFDAPSDGKMNGLHAGQLKAYIQFCLAICHKARTTQFASHKVTAVQTENAKFAMRTWLNSLGMIGDEFQTAREVFTKRLTGNSAWRRSA